MARANSTASEPRLGAAVVHDSGETIFRGEVVASGRHHLAS